MSLVKILLMLVIGVAIYMLGFSLMITTENKKISIPLMTTGISFWLISILLFLSGEYVLN